MEIFPVNTCAWGATRTDVEKLTKVAAYMAVMLMALHPTEFDTPEFRRLCEEAGMVFSPNLDGVLADARNHLHPYIP